uniref:Uncharacterized protein n=1 Tax=viral metagenome TaxID=1070528 RepID=A0A6H1ZAC0_9ZZZZ
MELGNLVFGYSRGEYPVPRTDFYYDQLMRLFQAIDPEYNSSYGMDFENATFSTLRYYWGECECGFEERAAEWGNKNNHAPTCYQTVFRLIRKAWRITHPEPKAKMFDVRCERDDNGVVTALSFKPTESKNADKWSAWYDKEQKFMDLLYDTLCAEFDRKYGCAVHCTCDYHERWAKFLETGDHKPDCLIIRPNFLHKSSGLEIRWYKYIGRDSYSNKKLNHKMFAKVIDDCIASLTPDDGIPF